jgi:hypothetical protein
MRSLARPTRSVLCACAGAVLVCSALPGIALPGQKPATAGLERPRWLVANNLQGSGIAIVGDEIWIVGDRSSDDKNTIQVFDHAAYAKGDSLAVVRKIVLDVAHPAIDDLAKKNYYTARICREGACNPLDIEDLALDAKGFIYVSVEGRPDAVLKFDPKTLRAVDLWPSVTGDEANLGAEGLAVTPDGAFIFVGHQKPAEVSVINTKTHWISKGPIDAEEVNGLAYDAAHRQLLVLDHTVPEIIRMTTDGEIVSRSKIGPEADMDPSGRKYVGLKFDAIALGPGGKAVWLVTDPPHTGESYYGPADKRADVPEGYKKGYSMLYRFSLGQ